MRRRPAGLLAVGAAALVAAACGGDDSNGEETAAAPEPTACRQVAQPLPKEAPTLNAPETQLEEGKSYRLTFKTNCGDFTIELDPEASPNATASFFQLAENGYFDDTTFHRVVPGFVIQGGDPTARGDGGPGYSTVDPPAADTEYTRGVVAMAKTQAEAPGTAGSQFFVVTAPDAGLPPDYAVIGRVTSGMEAVHKIEALGDQTTQRPSQAIVVSGVDAESS